MGAKRHGRKRQAAEAAQSGAPTAQVALALTEGVQAAELAAGLQVQGRAQAGSLRAVLYQRPDQWRSLPNRRSQQRPRRQKMPRQRLHVDS
jgi:hypothetical protein